MRARSPALSSYATCQHQPDSLGTVNTSTTHTYERITCIRCRGSSLACAALGCDLAGEVNHECIGAVMGLSNAAGREVASAEAGRRLKLGVSGMRGRLGK